MLEISYCGFCDKRFETMQEEYKHIVEEHKEEASHYQE